MMTDLRDTEMSCDRCAWWEGLGDGIGQCRRYAPRPRTSHADVVWPITEEHEFCGEFEDSEPMCACDDDETCAICADERVDEVFEAIVDGLTQQPRRRWWHKRRGQS